MYSFKIELADTVIGVDVLCKSTLLLCKNYITDKPAEMIVTISEEDINDERRFATVTDPSLPDLESMALYRRLCTELAKNNIVLIHGSCVAVDGKAYLFCAPSGTGKSTHTRLWRQYLGVRATMINDDKPLLRINDGFVMIYGTPWNGKHRLGSNTSVPLKSICFLDRGLTNTIEPCDKKKGIDFLLKYTFRPADPINMLYVLDTVSKIPSSCNFWTLKCNMDPESAKLSYETMSL